MVATKWAQYKNYSGLKLAGTVPVPLPDIDRQTHLDRAYYLTACLEAPFYGSVQSYDGAGMSGGPLHNIAVFPKTMKQGTLFALINHIRNSGTSSNLTALLDAFKEEGWVLAPDGLLYSDLNGALISGKEVRDVLSGPNGVVPKTGLQRTKAEGWINYFHYLFSDPATFPAQKGFAIDYLVRTQRVHEAPAYKGVNALTCLAESAAGPNCLSYEEDLALCTYHAHSVNGPAPALSVLTATLRRYPNRGPDFAKALIKGLGIRKYGHWEDTVDGRNRYDRTRFYAKKSGLWPDDFFVGRDAIMPENIVR